MASLALIKSQNIYLARLEKAYDTFKKSPKVRLAKESYLLTRLEALEELWKTLTSNHNKLILDESDVILQNTYFTADVFESIEEKYIDYKSDLVEALSLCKSASYSSSSCQHVPTSKNEFNVKLPKISIPTFSGLYSEWQTFRDLYVSLIHNNASIDSVQKMHYLKGHLSGEAEQLLRHVPITADNYQESWALLNSRYNNKRYLANCLLRRFMNQPSVRMESCNVIKDLLDTTNDTLNGLRNLGIEVNTWDIIIIYIICTKLDPETRKQWEIKISVSDELPTLHQMCEFLESRFRSLEFLDIKPKSNSGSTSQKPKVMHSIPITTASNLCSYCKKTDHKISNCKEFVQLNYKARHNFVQTNGLCFNCLGKNHSVKSCSCTTKCRVCKHKHHSLLHPKPELPKSEPCTSGLSKPEEIVETLSTNIPPSNVAAHFSKETAPNEVLLATAVVKSRARNGNEHTLRALLDQGSQASFITEGAVQLLGLRKIPTRSVISGLGGDSTLASKYIVAINLHSRHDPEFLLEVRAHVLSAITSLIPSNKVMTIDWPELIEISLADPQYDAPNKIDILLGADVYGQILRDGLIKDPNGVLTAQRTALGWILSGPTHQLNDDQVLSTNCHHNVIMSMHAHLDDNALLKQFWQIESDSFESKMLTEEEKSCEEFYSRTTQRDSSGRYIVSLPFREDDPQCKYGNSRDIALKRFHLLENRFKKNPEIKASYSKVMQEYLDLGHMERITGDEDNLSKSVYLPHHAVIREDKSTTKVRVVFDASCRGTNGVSLNDSLMVGPTLQQDLRHIIMRWRMHSICLSADIVKMYRQVVVSKQDADFQRLVWRDDPESETENFRLVRVTFGTASAPYLAVKTLQQVATDEGEDFPETATRIKTDFYVDDLLTGCETVAEGIRIHKEMTEMLGRGGFELQKWITNNMDLARVITDKQANQDEGLDIKMDEVVKVLGLSWDKASDSFFYSVKFPVQQDPITKRKVISDISRLFDPLGWVAPCVIVAKVMIQKLWLAGLDWDEELPDNLLKEWLTYQSELECLRDLYVPRWIGARNDDLRRELHGFSDASITSYAAVVYLRTVSVTGNTCVNLVAAKTKVAPTMQVSIPRLELMGAVLLAKLVTEVANVLHINSTDVHGWTDSTVVLAWLSSHPSRWSTFIGNRTSEILSRLDNTQWAHVQSNQNPADIASRGCTPMELAQCSMWLQGPLWLKDSLIEYTRPKSISTDLEKRKVKVHLTVDTSDNDRIWTRYSSLCKLIRVISYCRRFLKIKEVKMNQYKFEPYLTSSELDEALNVCIRQCQAVELNDKSSLKPLNPYSDDKGILRVQGRIQNASLPEDTKHPIILPHKSEFTNLVVDDAHKKTLHGGPLLMLNYLRTKYWIVSAKTLVKGHVRKCVKCVRHAATTKNQLMGQLPAARVTPARPFLHSGVDFAGPINIRMSKGRGNRCYKGYISLFVCMATKAIHLEAVSDLTAESFIACFKRFVARRHVSNVWSDNGTNFLGASKELQCIVDPGISSVATDIREWLSNNNVTWHFIPPHAPNHGGLWEAGVKSTKYHLKRVIDGSSLTFEEMATVLSQIEACLNSRPLSILPGSHVDPSPLTPGHFLVGEPLIVVPDHNYEQSNITSLRRWQLTQRMMQDFWRRWSEEYLVHCLQRYKWSKTIPEPAIGDIVLVKEDNLPPARWLLGKVTAKHPGLDKITRVVTLKCNGSHIKRPTSKLCILPVTN